MTVKKPRKVSSKVRLKNALEADDNLEILKAQRMMVFDDLLKCDEIKERVIQQQTLMNLSREIIKIEGSREERPEEDTQKLEEDFELRNNPFGG